VDVPYSFVFLRLVKQVGEFLCEFAQYADGSIAAVRSFLQLALS
jgi:hypothetical protein